MPLSAIEWDGHMTALVGGGGAGGPAPSPNPPHATIQPGTLTASASPGQPVPAGVTNRGLYLATIRSAQGEARYGISYDCNGIVYRIGGCLSQSGAAGVTPQQVKQSAIGAGTILTSAVPVGDLLEGLGIVTRAAAETPQVATATEAGGSAAEDGGIDASQLGRTATVARHAEDITKSGELARPYINSPLTVRSIMEAGDPIPDPGGVPGGLRWDVPGGFRGSPGTWELVIDQPNNQIVHFLFRGAP